MVGHYEEEGVMELIYAKIPDKAPIKSDQAQKTTHVFCRLTDRIISNDIELT